jgi:adenylyl-sulfate kinase
MNIIWIMGPSSSGKTTLGMNLIDKIRKMGGRVLHYDGDEIRGFFGKDFGFSEKDRLRVVKTLVHLANKGLDSGLNVVVSALTAKETAREYVAKNLKNPILIYLECSVEKCAERDPKGLYRKALRGEIKTMIGVSEKYRSPKNCHIILNTERNGIDCCLNLLFERLNGLGFVVS